MPPPRTPPLPTSTTTPTNATAYQRCLPTPPPTSAAYQRHLPLPLLTPATNSDKDTDNLYEQRNQ